MIIIKRRIALDFLGEDYKDSYLIFKSISIKDLEGIQAQAEVAQKDEKAAVPMILELLTTRFIEGKITGQDVTADDIGDLPVDVLLTCFEKVKGEIDPKG